MYSFDGKVRYSEVDYEGNLNFCSILDYFQDCSSFQSEELGIGIEFLKEHHVAWVLVSWQIEVVRYPRHGESIRICTWPYDFKAFYGYRNFMLTDERGECLARASSLWVLLDIENGRPTRVLPEMEEKYVLEPPLPLENSARKMKMPSQMKTKESFAVHKFHLDTNQHVNNGKYILMAQEYLPERFKIGKMRAEYKKSAVYGDVIHPYVKEEEDKIVVALCDEQQKPYVIIEVEKKND